MVEIRPFKLADLEQAMELAKAMHAEAPAYRDIPFDEDKVRAMFMMSTSKECKGFSVLVALDEDKIVGGFIGAHSEHFFTKANYSTEMATYVTPSHRRSGVARQLVEAFEVVAKQRGSAWVGVGVSTGVDNAAISDLYRTMGYKDFAVTLMKGLPDV